jgi:hypothetical protein
VSAKSDQVNKKMVQNYNVASYFLYLKEECVEGVFENKVHTIFRPKKYEER